MTTNEIIAGLRKLSGQGSEYRRTVCRLAADTIEAQQKRIAELEEERRWIPVTERMPENDNQVLAIVSGRWENITFDHAYELASWSAEEGWIMEAWPELENPEVTHWKPLPESVKEGKA